MAKTTSHETKVLAIVACLPGGVLANRPKVEFTSDGWVCRGSSIDPGAVGTSQSSPEAACDDWLDAICRRNPMWVAGKLIMPGQRPAQAARLPAICPRR